MIFSVKSFLSSSGRLIPVEEFADRVEDPAYIEGALHVELAGKVLISTDVVDLVDQLWVYLTDGLSFLEEHSKFQTYLPDQPIELSFEYSKDRRYVKFGRVGPESRYLTVERNLFLSVMVCGGTSFFTCMKRLVPRNCGTYQNALSDLNALVTT